MSFDENEDLSASGGVTRDRGLGMEILDRLGPPLVLGWLAIAVGLVLVLVGYWKVSGTSDVAEQLAYFASACVGGLFALGAGGVLILSHHYQESARATAEMRRALVHLVREGGLVDPGFEQGGSGVGEPRQGGGRRGAQKTVMRVAGGPSFHSPSCIFVQGKDDVGALTTEEAIDLDLRPCQICDPSYGVAGQKKVANREKTASSRTGPPKARNPRSR